MINSLVEELRILHIVKKFPAVMEPKGSSDWCFNHLQYKLSIFHLLAGFPYFEKINLGLWKHHAACMSVNPPLSTFECLNQSLWNLVCLSWHLSSSNSILHKYLPSVCVFVCVSLLPLLDKGSVQRIPLFIARQRLSKHVTMEMNISKNIKNVGRIILHMVCVSSKECLWVSVSPCCCYVKTRMFPQQWRIVGGVIFCAAYVISKESRQLVLPRISFSVQIMWSQANQYERVSLYNAKMLIEQLKIIKKLNQNAKTKTEIAEVYIILQSALSIYLKSECDRNIYKNC
jgi:hypothetical protein